MTLQKNWQLKIKKTEKTKELVEDLGISTILAQLLINRGFEEANAAENFLNASLEDLSNPHDIPGVNLALERIRKAVKNKERIVIYGDYDVDGITSTALLLETFRFLGFRAGFYIPHRITEGYGLNRGAIQKLVSKKADLVITVDCGISSYATIAEGQRLGLDFIVTDHHLPPEQLPNCILINPALETAETTWKKLAGVGVAFKLAQALLEDKFGKIIGYKKSLKLLDLVALGTIADLVPLRDENRILVKYGLEIIAQGERLGLRKLAQISKINLKNISSGQIAYGLAPRINACGRIDNPALGVQLLISKNEAEAERIALRLNSINQDRQNMESEITMEAIEMVEKNNLDQQKCILLSSPHWHSGLIGIAAARLAEKYYRPTILFTINNGLLKGSGRSIQGFHLYNTLGECEDLLESFGGHSQAAGLNICPDNWQQFYLRFNQLAEKSLKDADLAPSISLDAEINLEKTDFAIWDEISQLEPFGLSNPEPLLVYRGGEIKNYQLVGSGEEHLKLKIKAGNSFWNGIGFNLASNLEIAAINEPMDLAFAFNKNTWLGRNELQLILKDFKPSYNYLD